MSEDHRLTKINILLQQSRFADAERVLKDLLSEDPNNPYYLSLLAETSYRQDKYEEAGQLIDHAIGMAPDSPHLFYLKCRIEMEQNKYDEAENLIQHAIELDPYDADYFALHAHIKMLRKQYQNALEIADQALSIDPQHILGLNTRSSALLKLDKSEESFATIEGALREDPNNAYTHANYGWGLLEKGNHNKALEHFRESLQQNPNYAYAQSGLLEALKAKNFIYRGFLKYSFFMQNLTSKNQWAVIIALYVGVRFLRYLSSTNETLGLILGPIILLITLAAFSTWVIAPISNLFLRFNKYGKLLLSKKEILSSNFVACAFLISILGGLLFILTLKEPFLLVLFFSFALAVPYGSMFSLEKNFNPLVIYAIVMTVIGATAVALAFTTGNTFNTVSGLFILGFFGYQWVANYFITRSNTA